MNLKIYYKNLSSRIASKWTILAIDICLIMISMLLACILQLGVSSIIYKMSLYVWMIFFSLFCNLCFFSVFHTYVGVIRFSSFVDIYRVFISLTLSYGVLVVGNFCWSAFGLGETLPSGIIFIAYIKIRAAVTLVVTAALKIALHIEEVPVARLLILCLRRIIYS